MKPGALIICFACFILLFPVRGFAQRGVEVKPIDGGMIHTDPRNVVTSLFTVTNTGSQPLAFTSELDLPKGWKLITRDFLFTLNPGQSQTRLLSFFVPQMTTAGLYEIPCIVKSRNHPSISDFYIINVNVQPITAVSVQILNGPEFIIAGNEYRVDFLVLNESNQPVDLKLSASSRQKFLFNLEASELHFNPAESKPVTITVYSHPDFKTKTADQLILTAQVVEKPDIITQAKHRVDIIPRVFGSKDIYHRLPVKLSLNHIAAKTDAWNRGFQAEVSGKGFLDEDKSKYISFLAKAPDQRSISLFGQYDEYKVQYYSDKYDLGMGDLAFGLSPLTEPGFYARGTEGRFRISRFVFGGHVANSRMIADEEKQIGAFAKYNIEGENLISLNYLSKSFADENYHIWSVNSEIKPLSDTQISLEYAGSASDENASGTSSAFLADALHINDRYLVKLKGLYANPDFQGYYKDQKYLSMAGTYNFNDQLRISGDFVFDRKNLDLVLDLGPAAERKYYRLRMNYRVPGKASVFFDLIQEERTDKQTDAKFDFIENSARIGTFFSYNNFSFNIAAEAGKTDNHLSGTDASFQRYSLSSNYSHHAGLSGSGYIAYDTSSDYEGLDRQKITYGLNLKSKIGNRSCLGLSARSTKQFELENEKDHDVKLSLDHTLASKWKLLDQSTISANVWHSENSNDSDSESEETAFKMSWTIPFNVPVSRKKNFGTAKGKVYDKITNIPMADVVIRIDGQIAVTDSDGEFVFPNLPAGPAYLNANASTIKGNRIFCEKMPLPINVKSGETVTLDLPVIEPASFSGQINIYDFKTFGSEFDVVSDSLNKGSSGSKYHAAAKELAKTGAIANALIEMDNGSHVTRRLTDKKGRFSFDALVPGKYRMKIKGAQVPEYHKLENEVFEIELRRDKHEEMEIKVLPIKRTMKLLPSVPLVIEEE